MEIRSGGIVLFETAGYSMWPFVRQGQKLVVKECLPDALYPGDVVAYRQGSAVVCHRLVGMRRCGARQELFLRGDMSYSRPERVTGSCVIGKVVGVMHGTRRIIYGKYRGRLFGLIILVIAPLLSWSARCLQLVYDRLRGKIKA